MVVLPNSPLRWVITSAVIMCLELLSWPLILKKWISWGEICVRMSLVGTLSLQLLPHDQMENAGHGLIPVSCQMMMLACELINVLDLPSIMLKTVAFYTWACVHNNTSHTGSLIKCGFLFDKSIFYLFTEIRYSRTICIYFDIEISQYIKVTEVVECLF